MSTQLPRTLAEVAAYIDKHEEWFGFKPCSYNLAFPDWMAAKNEAEQWMRYTDPAPPKTTGLSINGVPIFTR